MRGRFQLAMALGLAQLVAGCNAPVKAPVPPLTPTPTSASAGATTIVAIAPPAAPATPPNSLCNFLGLDKSLGVAGELFRRVSSRVRSALGLEGRFPGLQPKPPLLPITDPSNLGPDAPPAVQAAASVKNEEDQSAQKVQALRYLATIGCGGCYPTVEDALLAGLDDCTEAVRYAAVLALRGDGNTCCTYCRCESCCSPKVRKKLNSIAYDQDGQGCFKEPSERVRRMARLVLAACGGYSPEQSLVPTEGPTPAPPMDGAPPGAPAGPTPAPPAPAATSIPAKARGLSPVQLVSFEQTTEKASPHDPLLARVNGEPIHESDVMPLVEAEAARRKLRGMRVDGRMYGQMIAEQVERAVDAKLLLQRARRDLTAAGRSNVAGANTAGAAAPLTPTELETWLRSNIVVDTYVAVAEIDAAYQAQLGRFRPPPQVRWEQFSVAATDAGSREKALALVTHLRDRAAGVASEPPEVDPAAAVTIKCDFTVLDRIQPQVVATALASLPVGASSPILEDHGEFFVVRVLDRKVMPPTPFDEVMGILRDEMLEERRRRAEEGLFLRWRDEGQIWMSHVRGTAVRTESSPPPATADGQVRPVSHDAPDGRRPPGGTIPLGAALPFVRSPLGAFPAAHGAATAEPISASARPTIESTGQPIFSFEAFEPAPLPALSLIHI